MAHTLVAIRTDVTYPTFEGSERGGRLLPPCPITSTDMPDEEWIPVVARENWTIISRDQAIQRRTAEKAAVRQHGAKMFAIAAPGQLRSWDLLRLTLRHWDVIEASCDQDGPFIYRLTMTNAELVPLD